MPDMSIGNFRKSSIFRQLHIVDSLACDMIKTQLKEFTVNGSQFFLIHSMIGGETKVKEAPISLVL